MGKLFGTDGIRGIANKTLDAELAFRIGSAVAFVFGQRSSSRPVFLIGKDTRISGDMLESALCSGICTYGGNVTLLGVIPTPAVAYLTVDMKASAGVVISASHNPYEHNGIKLFSSTGFKLSDELEEEIEQYILNPELLPEKKTGEHIGTVSYFTNAIDKYTDFLASTVSDVSGIRILVDCANGASSESAKCLFQKLRVNADFISDTPNGININVNCGSTHLKTLSEKVREGNYTLGFAFDGDADRCLAVDEHGEPVDGDQIMAICSAFLVPEGKLKGNGFVATIMSNIGLHRYCLENNIRLLCAPVGDRYVLEMMQKENMSLGGEQSGHIIFLDILTTGDGELTAIQLLQIFKQAGVPLSELAGKITHYPQVLINVPGPASNSEKKALIASKEVQNEVHKVEENLKGNGRVLLRPSGTEPLIRVMVEADTQEKADTAARYLADFVANCTK